MCSLKVQKLSIRTVIDVPSGERADRGPRSSITLRLGAVRERPRSGDRGRAHRVGFGLFLIVAFSFGLATVLIMTGMFVVLAGRFVLRMNPDAPLLRKWLPMASATAVTVLGFAIAGRALLAGGRQ